MDDSLAVLRVYANPYAHVDHKGRAAGACSCEAINHVAVGDRRWVGASLHPKLSVHKEREGGDLRAPTGEVVFEFSNEVQTIPDTPHYKARIRDGALVPADEETADLANVPFVDPAKKLAGARDRALAALKVHAPKRIVAKFEAEPLFQPAGPSPASPPTSPAASPAPPPAPAPAPTSAKGGN